MEVTILGAVSQLFDSNEIFPFLNDLDLLYFEREMNKGVEVKKEVNEVIDFFESLFDIPALDDLVEPFLESVADSIPSADTIKEPVIALVDSIPNVDVIICKNITQGMNGITDDLLLTDCLIEAIGLDINAIELD